FVTVANVEVIEVDGLEGDDSFDVLSTAPGVAYRVIGGLGSDVINVAGDVAGSVFALDIEGSSGTINHDVRSADPAYNGLIANGIDLSVARPQQGAVIITESDGFTAVGEDFTGRIGTTDTYTVAVAARPDCGVGLTCLVYVTASSGTCAQEEAGNAEGNGAGGSIVLEAGRSPDQE